MLPNRESDEIANPSQKCAVCGEKEIYQDVCPHCLDTILLNIHTMDFYDQRVTTFIEAALTNNPVALEAVQPLTVLRDVDQLTRCQSRLLGSQKHQCNLYTNHEGAHEHDLFRWGNVDQ